MLTEGKGHVLSLSIKHLKILQVDNKLKGNHAVQYNLKIRDKRRPSRNESSKGDISDLKYHMT